MSKFKSLTAAIGLTAGLAFSSAGSAVTITNADGTFDFTGFDYAQGGTAFTSGFTNVPGSTFTLTYFGWASALQNGPTTFVPGHMDINANGVQDCSSGAPCYEYTIVATLQETFVGCTPTCSFAVNSGTFDIWYDTTADANTTSGSLGTGYTDGVKVISGTVPAQPGGTFATSDFANGFGIAVLQGNVTTTNTTFINPALGGTTAATTLQIGSFQTSYTNPGGFNGAAFPPASSGQLVFQADANQSFRAVPEPATLAMLGLGLLGVGSFRRRK